MQKTRFGLLIIALVSIKIAQAQPRLVSEVSVVYELSIDDQKADPAIAKTLHGSLKNLHVKGHKARTELVTPAFRQVLLFDNRSDTTVLLRELGNTKYLSYIDDKKRSEYQKKYDGATFVQTEDTKTILGYECSKVVATLQDGTQYSIFYTPSIIPSNRTFEFQFRNLEGFPLEYEALSEDGKTRVRYTANKITFTPVPIALFDVPKSGYRLL